MESNVKKMIKELSKNYMLFLCYNNGNEIIKDIFKVSAIVDKNDEIISYDTLVKYNLFLLEKEYGFKLVFSSKNSSVIIPLHYIESIFNNNSITSELLLYLAVSKYLLDEDKVSEIVNKNSIKLNKINAEYVYNGSLNNDNYSIMPIKLKNEITLSDLLVNVTKEEYQKVR